MACRQPYWLGNSFKFLVVSGRDFMMIPPPAQRCATHPCPASQAGYFFARGKVLQIKDLFKYEPLILKSWSQKDDIDTTNKTKNAIQGKTCKAGLF